MGRMRRHCGLCRVEQSMKGVWFIGGSVVRGDDGAQVVDDFQRELFGIEEVRRVDLVAALTAALRVKLVPRRARI